MISGIKYNQYNKASRTVCSCIKPLKEIVKQSTKHVLQHSSADGVIRVFYSILSIDVNTLYVYDPVTQ